MLNFSDYIIAFCVAVIIGMTVALLLVALQATFNDPVEQDLAQFEARYNYCMSTEHFTPNECAIFAGSDR